MIEGAVELKDATDEQLALYAVGKMKLVSLRKSDGAYLMPCTPKGKSTSAQRAYFRKWYLQNKHTELQKKRMAGAPTAPPRTEGPRKKKRNPAFQTTHPSGTREWGRAYKAFRKAGGQAAYPGAGGHHVARTDDAHVRDRDVVRTPGRKRGELVEQAITGTTRAERQRIAKRNWYVRNREAALADGRRRYEAKKGKPVWEKPVIREATPRLGIIARTWNALTGWSL